MHLEESVHRDRLVVSAEVPMEQLFSPGEGAQDEVFAFDRTLSRLREMGAHEYLTRGASASERASELFVLYDASTEVTREVAEGLFKACYKLQVTSYKTTLQLATCNLQLTSYKLQVTRRTTSTYK